MFKINMKANCLKFEKNAPYLTYSLYNILF